MSGQKSKGQRGKEQAARIWLSYYNRVLYEKGVVTGWERSKLDLKISSRKIHLT